MRFGLIGFGRFGKLWARALTQLGEVWVYDPTRNVPKMQSGIESVSIDRVTQVEILFLTVPISAIATVCLEIKDLLNEHTLVADCGSVKCYPIGQMQTILSEAQPIIGTHPLFGPDSVAKTHGLKGHRMVICPARIAEERLARFKEMLESLGLTVIMTSADDHDQQMAHSQALIHFIGRGLEVLHIHPQVLATPDFNALLNINKMVVNDTWQLFCDMQRFNPYTQAMRKSLIEQLMKIDHDVQAMQPKLAE